MSIPYIGFSNSTLNDLPRVKPGDEVHCPRCNERHTLKGVKDEKGNPSELLLFYDCGVKSYLGAVSGRLVAHTKTDCHGAL